ncbi:MAG: TIR domain-containing protein [Ktedonobacterales bacterium]|nr:TIR domain-containing protein [Ktedonobacterales bacterium]
MALPLNVPTMQDDQLPAQIDVAISYAGPERDYAKALAERVVAAGFVPFYDQYYPQAIWGADLAVLFDQVYRQRARYCVMFISEEYLARPWTNHERQSAIARAIQERGQSYILPIMVNGPLEIPGIASSVIGHLSLQQMGIDAIADVLISKLRA